MNRHFDKYTGRMAQIGLTQQVALRAMWSTPTANDAQKTGAPSQLNRNTPQLGDLVSDRAGGQLNPQFVEYLMNYPKDWTDLTVSKPNSIMGNYGKTTNSLSGEELRGLRDGINPQGLQRDAGRPQGVHAEEILRSSVYGESHDQGERDASWIESQGSETQGDEVPSLRINNQPANTSSGFKPGEQCPKQSDDIMQFLSSEMALDTWQENYGPTDYLQDMRRACAEIGYVPETLSEIQEVWRSTTDEEKDWIKIRISTRNPWHSEWPGVPRVASGVKDRVNRLKCLGNSIVPQIAMMIFQQAAFDEWRHP